ncbi:MAG: hypothetical protein AB7L90_25540 [Hyphomicrobiaceae bacterium]
MTFARASCVVAGLSAGLVAALGLGGITHPISLMEAPTIAHAIAIAATSVVAMLTTAVGALIVADWQADVRSRHDWAQLGLPPAHLCLAAELAPVSHIDPRYLTFRSDKALRQVFRTHHAAAQMAFGVPVPGRSTEVSCAQPMQDQGHGASALSEADAVAVVRILPTLVSASARAARASPVYKGEQRTKEIASRSRLVANGDTWPDWVALDSPRAEKDADALVLSAGRDDRAQPFRKASVASNGAETTARPACRGPPRSLTRRCDAAGSKPEQRWAVRATAPSDDLVVRDDLGPQIAIIAAELDVMETYLGDMLDDLLASSVTKPESGKG